MRYFTTLVVLGTSLLASQAFAEPAENDNVPTGIVISDRLMKKVREQFARDQEAKAKLDLAQSQTAAAQTAGKTRKNNDNEDLISLFVGLEFNQYNADQVDFGAFRQYPNNYGINGGVKWAPFSDAINFQDNYFLQSLKRTKFLVELSGNSHAGAGFNTVDHWDTFTNPIDTGEEFSNVCYGRYHGYDYRLDNCYPCSYGYADTGYCYDTTTPVNRQADGQAATFVQGGVGFGFEVPLEFGKWAVAPGAKLQLTFLGTGVVEDQLQTNTRVGVAPTVTVARKIGEGVRIEGNVAYGSLRNSARGLDTMQYSARVRWDFKNAIKRND